MLLRENSSEVDVIPLDLMAKLMEFFASKVKSLFKKVMLVVVHDFFRAPRPNGAAITEKSRNDASDDVLKMQYEI